MTITKRPPRGQGDAETFIAGAPDAGTEIEIPGVRKGRRRQITHTISPPVLAAVDHQAREMGMSRAAVINLAIYQFLRRTQEES